MALSVVVRSGDPRSPPTLTFDAPRIVIGRGDGCEVRLPDPSVSHRHASIRVQGTDYAVMDEGSTNGTFVGSTRLSPGAPHVVRSGALVRVGRVWLEIRIEQVAAPANAASATKEMALALVSDALAAQGERVAARVYVAEGPDAGLETFIEEIGRRYVVGRSKNVDLAVSDEDASRRHVEILRKGEQIFVRELGSKNGSSLGDEPLVPDRETRWPLGKVLHVGANRLAYEDPVVEALNELERAADEYIPKGETIDPPAGGSDDDDDATSEHEAEDAVPSHDPGDRRAAPVTDVPEAPPERPRREPRPGWGPADFLIALLALVVLGLSLVGLWWLFRGS